MGLTVVTAHSNHRVLRYGTWSPRPEVDGVGWGELVYLNSDLHAPLISEDRISGRLEDCWVHVSGNKLSFRQKSYRRFVQYLSWVFLGASPHEVRKDPAGYYGRPFVEHIASTCYSTVIGPNESTKLLQDYTEHRQHFIACIRRLALNPMDWEHGAGSEDLLFKDLIDHYDNWIRAFAIASETGIIYAQYKSALRLP